MSAWAGCKAGYMVSKVRLFEKSSVRRENLGTRLLSGSPIGWFHYLFVWNKMYFFLTHKPWYFMKTSIAFDPVFDRVLEKRETSVWNSRANWDWALKEISMAISMATVHAEHVCSKIGPKVTFLDSHSRYSYITSIGTLSYSSTLSFIYALEIHTFTLISQVLSRLLQIACFLRVRPLNWETWTKTTSMF